MHYAHSRNDRGERQELLTHLRNVAQMASSFAAGFGASEAGYYLGLWHDAGKFSPAFQRYLLETETPAARRRRGPDHKAAGSEIATRYLWLLAMAIQAHHGGLRSPEEFRTWLSERKAKGSHAEALDIARHAMPDLLPSAPLPVPTHAVRDPIATEFLLRMLFSALVDADFVDTERHMRPDRAGLRGPSATMAELWERFRRFHETLHTGDDGPVARVRRIVYEACLAAADRPPGLFRLTVPTGGGKTLSGMAFALRHALRHGHRRVIVAVPFISITEQTADVYREVFESAPTDGPVVLEHHSGASNLAPDSEDFDPAYLWRRLAAENWDAPIVVTTTVQLFESLFASSPSGCRKLHRLAGSVLILDEAQVLPPHLLTPILDALRQLCSHYGTTVVLSTATQPAFESIQPFRDLDATEIVPDPARLFRELSRVTYEWRTDPPLAWEEVASLMRDQAHALAVVNTRGNAMDLLDSLGDPEALHLSTQLCGAHRRLVIAEVRRRLREGEPCRLVSTQVVEAGVDLDFPLVLRALGPLDGIIQAAGRCNREGRLHRGRVVVFEPRDGSAPKGSYLTGIGVTRALLGAGRVDPDDPDTARRYFGRLFELQETDREGIQRLRSSLNYPEVSRRFRMIDEPTESVVVPFGPEEDQRKVAQMLDGLREGNADARDLIRRFQPYLVSIRTREADTYRRRGLIDPVLPGLGRWLGAYDPVRGLVGEGLDPGSFVI